MEPHHCRCFMPSTPLFPVHAHWCPRGSRKGVMREQVPHPWHGWRARMPGHIIPGSDAGRRRTKPLKEAAAPRAPDPRGERVRPPDSAPYLDPSFQNTALPSRTPEHDEDTRPPCLFWTLHPLWTLFYYFCSIKFYYFITILLFLFNKSLSEAWRHTHCVCRLLLPPQYIL